MSQDSLSLKGYNVVKQLGSGSFAVVVLATQAQRTYAIKIIDMRILDQQPYLSDYINGEIDVMSSLDSKYIIKFYESFQDDFNIYIVMEYAEQNMMDFLFQDQKQRGLSEHDALEYFVQILNGIYGIHSKGYLHRDIKPENILLHKGVIKIADFGFAKQVGSDMTQTQCGTDEYMAPEVADGQPYNHKGDIWSLGVVLYRMLFIDSPWGQSMRVNNLKIEHTFKQQFDPVAVLQATSKNREKIEKAQALSVEIKDLMSRMLRYEQDERINWDDIFAHPVFRSTSNVEFQQEVEKRVNFYRKDFQKKTTMRDDSIKRYQQQQKSSRISQIKSKIVAAVFQKSALAPLFNKNLLRLNTMQQQYQQNQQNNEAAAKPADLTVENSNAANRGIRQKVFTISKQEVNSGSPETTGNGAGIPLVAAGVAPSVMRGNKGLDYFKVSFEEPFDELKCLKQLRAAEQQYNLTRQRRQQLLQETGKSYAAENIIVSITDSEELFFSELSAAEPAFRSYFLCYMWEVVKIRVLELTAEEIFYSLEIDNDKQTTLYFFGLIILFYTQKLYLQLDRGENQFQQENWENFLHSRGFSQLTKLLYQDCKRKEQLLTEIKPLAIQELLARGQEGLELLKCVRHINFSKFTLKEVRKQFTICIESVDARTKDLRLKILLLLSRRIESVFDATKIESAFQLLKRQMKFTFEQFYFRLFLWLDTADQDSLAEQLRLLQRNFSSANSSMISQVQQ